MTKRQKVQIKLVAAELDEIYNRDGGLNPHAVVEWAKKHPDSELHKRFQWDNTKAAHEYRVWQARVVITEVKVVYPDRKPRQVYVSPIESRGAQGYARLVDVMDDAELRTAFLNQALAEYERLAGKYHELVELAEVHSAVEKAAKKARAKRKPRSTVARSRRSAASAAV